MQAAVERFGRIDVLVNNAGNFYAGFFEELTLGTSGPRSRRPCSAPSTSPAPSCRSCGPSAPASSSPSLDRRHRRPGVRTAYAAAKFGVEAGSSRQPEVAPFGIRTMLVEPGFFRTELLSPESTNYAEASIDDYAERTTQTVAAWKAMNGQQEGTGQARQRAGPAGQPGPAAAALGGRRRRHRHGRAEGQRPPGPGRRLPRAVQQPRPRRRLNPPPTRTQQANRLQRSHRHGVRVGRTLASLQRPTPARRSSARDRMASRPAARRRYQVCNP